MKILKVLAAVSACTCFLSMGAAYSMVSCGSGAKGNASFTIVNSGDKVAQFIVYSNTDPANTQFVQSGDKTSNVPLGAASAPISAVAGCSTDSSGIVYPVEHIFKEVETGKCFYPTRGYKAGENYTINYPLDTDSGDTDRSHWKTDDCINLPES